MLASTLDNLTILLHRSYLYAILWRQNQSLEQLINLWKTEGPGFLSQQLITLALTGPRLWHSRSSHKHPKSENRSEFKLLQFQFSSLLMRVGKYQKMAQVLYPCHSHGKSGWYSRLLPLALSTPSCFGIWGISTVDERSFSARPSFSLCNLPFK